MANVILVESTDPCSDERSGTYSDECFENSAVAPSTIAEASPAKISVHQSFHAFIDQQLADDWARCEFSEAQFNTLSPISLAYIGDAVFELYVRSRLLFPAKRIRDYHNQVVSSVKAEQQAEYLDRLIESLTDSEKDILRQGRNATSGRHRRADAQQYQKSTGFEALLGYLYLRDRSRLIELLNQLAI